MFVCTCYNPACGLEGSVDVSRTTTFKVELRITDDLSITTKINASPHIIHSLIILKSFLSINLKFL